MSLFLTHGLFTLARSILLALAGFAPLVLLRAVLLAYCGHGQATIKRHDAQGPVNLFAP